MFQWSREAFEARVASRCWLGTPYDTGWCKSAELGLDPAVDDELRAVVEMEYALDRVPAWAVAIVERSIRYVPPTGHYTFPRPFVEVVDAIGTEKEPTFIHGCYTADPDRKQRMLDYCSCLGAWLEGTDPSASAGELERSCSSGVKWPTVCHDLWHVLGQRTQLKQLLIERALHRYRWWCKTLVWDNDSRDKFECESYLGDPPCGGECYGNPGFGDPYFAELGTERVLQLEKAIQELTSDAPWFRQHVEQSWLCAPKAFRFVERLLYAIGRECKLRPGEEVPAFLQCQDTLPDRQRARKWWSDFLAALRGWVEEKPPNGDVALDVSTRLGRRTDVKRWLVRLYAHRLKVLQAYAEIGKLVGRARAR